jgi:transposase
MDPFHVVALAGVKLDLCRHRVQQHTRGHRGRTGDPLYGIRRVARTREELLSDQQRRRLEKVFGQDQHLPVAVTWRIYQDIIDAYADPDRRRAKTKLTRVIDTICTGVPDGLEELAQLGRTLHRRRADVLAYFSVPGLERTHRSDQRTARSTAPARPGIPQPTALPDPVIAALRQPHRRDRCTLNPEEPVWPVTT